MTPPSQSASEALSAQIESRYCCQLSDDLADWFDSKIWQSAGGAEYREVADPQDLLSETPESIWPCLMPCDFLPLIGNGEGDWLGVRVDAQNRASEIVQWYHGGGDWIPWGASLAEAILFDAVANRLPGPKRRHAVPAGPVVRQAQHDDWTRWAIQHLPKESADAVDADCESDELARVLLQVGVSEVAVRCELIQDALSESLSATFTPKVAGEFEIDWNTAVEWMFDVERIPEKACKKLQSKFGFVVETPQDWQSAAEHARRITQLSPELACGWDLLGYAQAKLGETERAIECYVHGAAKSVFTDQSVRLRTHWSSTQSAKFSTARLLEIRPDETNEYYRLQTDGNAKQRRTSVTEYWSRHAEQSSTEPAHCLENWIAAGWDLGAEPMTAFGEILEKIVIKANAANQPARAAVAQTHRSVLRDRYGA